jgi:hypothetical protein
VCLRHGPPARLFDSRRRAAECAAAHREEREIVAGKAIRLIDDRHEAKTLELVSPTRTAFIYVIGISDLMGTPK